MSSVDFQIVEWFFDRQKVKDAVDRGNRQALSKAGAYVRKRARSSIRRRKRVSQPGQPPSAHATDSAAPIKNILFGYDAANQSVVVGPVKLSSRAGDAPHVLEFGGDVSISEKLVRGRWIPRTWRRDDPGKQTRTRKAQYSARPFMGPALAAEAEHLAGFFVNVAR